MAQIVSKLTPICASCVEILHPWTQHCYVSVYGYLISGLWYAFRVYSGLYTLSLLSKRRVPKLNDLKNTLLSIMRSTIFLGINSCGIILFSCTLRNLLGRFFYHTVAAVPTFLASLCAILIEPSQSRRLLLCLYVSNLATETLWNMATSKNMVTPIKHGQVAIFSISMTVLLFYYKYGLHKIKEDQKVNFTFKTIKFLVGPYEEKKFLSNDINQSNGSPNENVDANQSSKNKTPYSLIFKTLEFYKIVINWSKKFTKHETCIHPFSCLYYTLDGCSKMFGVGLGIQIILKCVLNFMKILKSPKSVKSIFYKKDIFYLGMFLGGFAGLYKLMSCTLRRITGTDSPFQAIPAGLVAGTAFIYFPNTTVALYVFWKMLQLTYDLGIQKGVLPKIPRFTEFLYALSSAVIIHSAILEPATARPSYLKFVQSLSGGRLPAINKAPMDVWGVNSPKIMEIWRKIKLSQ